MVLSHTLSYELPCGAWVVAAVVVQPAPLVRTLRAEEVETRVLRVDPLSQDEARELALRYTDGHEVRAAHDGLTALKLAESYQPEVVLLDIGLPGLDGYEVARRLRGKHKAIYTPHVDTGDFIVVVNVEKLRVTGNKAQDKMYYRHTGYPGGIRQQTFKEKLGNDFLKLATINDHITKKELEPFKDANNLAMFRGGATYADAITFGAENIDKKLVEEFSKVKGKKVLKYNAESDLTDYLQLYNDLAK